MGLLLNSIRKDSAKDLPKAYVKALVARRLRMSKGRKLPKAQAPLHPKLVQNFYFGEMKPMLKALKIALKSEIIPRVKEIIAQAQESRPKNDSFREDAYSDEIKAALRKGKLKFEGLFSSHRYKPIAEKVASRTNDFNSKQTNRVFKSVLGVDVFKNESWLEQEMKAFIEHNVKYIKSIPDQFFDRVENTIFQGARTGSLLSDISDKLESDFDITENRAALIARDQVATFNSGLTQMRQKEVGVEKYIWKTSEDDRVRGDPSGLYPKAIPSHFDLDGRTFTWAEGPSETDGQHPGEPINCRCVAIPVFESSDEIKEGAEEDEE